jgi:SWI/SNF-related matrix-associated actin-dependent regulator of chromatin subfamily A3
VEGQLTGEKGAFDMPMRLTLFGPSSPIVRQELEVRLKADRILTATELKKTKKSNDLQRELQRVAMGLRGDKATTAGLPAESSGTKKSASKSASKPASQASMEDLLEVSQAMVFRSTEDIVKALAMDEDQLSKMPLAAQPDQLETKLHAYQLQGLEWLRAKEAPTFPTPGSDDAVQLWKRDQQGLYVNVATSFKVKEAPKLLSGGILADDMGLGKTVQILSLIVTGGPGPTLIVAPVTVMSNWEQQAERHVEESYAPRVLIYHGNRKTATEDDLKKYKIVITSYGTLTTAYKTLKKGHPSPLFEVDWRRIVLDEGHNIRNATTQTAQAACDLKAQSRWVLTGTPM